MNAIRSQESAIKVTESHATTSQSHMPPPVGMGTPGGSFSAPPNEHGPDRVKLKASSGGRLEEARNISNFKISRLNNGKGNGQKTKGHAI